jgi:hypothetical protein
VTAADVLSTQLLSRLLKSAVSKVKPATLFVSDRPLSEEIENTCPGRWQTPPFGQLNAWL